MVIPSKSPLSREGETSSSSDRAMPASLRTRATVSISVTALRGALPATAMVTLCFPAETG